MLYSTESCYNEIDVAALLFLIIGFLKLLEKSWTVFACCIYCLSYLNLYNYSKYSFDKEEFE